MPLNTQLQDVNRIMDPGVKSFSTGMGAFNLAYQYAANRRRERDEQEQAFGQLTSSLQTDSSGKTVPQMLAEFSQLPVDQMEQKIATMAPMAMTPAGSRIISVFSNIADKKRLIENQSAKKLLESEYNRRVAGALAKFGGNPQDPASISKAMRNQSYFEILDLAKGHSKDPSLPLPPDAIDDTGMINMQAVQQWISELPADVRTRTSEDIAYERFQTQRDIAEERDGRGFAPSSIERDWNSYKSILGREPTTEERERFLGIRIGTIAKASAAGQFVTRAEVNALVKRREKLAEEADILERDLATLQKQKTPKTETIESSQAELNLIRKTIDGINSQLQSVQADGSNQPPSSNIPSATPPGKIRKFNEKTGKLE